jgi:hypothetical protein
MNFAYFTIFSLFSSSVFIHCAHGHSHSHYQYSEHHDEHTGSHHHHHDSDSYRALRETSPFVIGNRQYADEKAFINSGNRCGSRSPTMSEMTDSSRIVAKYMATRNGRRDQAVSVEVPTYFHVITSTSTDDIDDDSLQTQLDVLNESFQVHGFSFRLIQTTRTENSVWFNAGYGSQEQDDMKSTLRTGDRSSLNVYFSAAGGNLGYATFPSDYSNRPFDDGVVILNDSVPGGSATNFNDGKTLVHEVGHWFGLYHTFQSASGLPIVGSLLTIVGLRNGCNTAGDEVNDTPAQKTPTTGCPVGRDSCPRQSGLDPINNYMDYSYDPCMTEFTSGQSDRMAAMWNEYRA